LKIIILPVGQVPIDVLQFIKQGLKEIFLNIEAVLHETSMPLPSEAYNSSRRQYYSTRILTKIRNTFRKSESRYVLGVTEADLYVPALNFVFGEAQMRGNASIISLFRLKPEFYGELPYSRLFHERALKEAVHEIGHTLGLEHCKRPTCVMYFSNSILDTDRKTATYCEKCRSSVLTALQRKS